MRAIYKITYTTVVLGLALISLWPARGIAQNGPRQSAVKILGRENAIVTTSEIRLGDLAEVSSPRLEDDEVVIGLKRLVVLSSPNPGDKIDISAGKVLERLREEGVELKQIGYSFPKNISVLRAGRDLGKEEVLQQINQYLSEKGRDISIKELSYPDSVRIAPGDVTYEIASFETGRSGEVGFSVKAKVAEAPETQIKLIAHIDEWRELPVASRAITRGSVIGAADFAMARMNLSKLPRDAALNVEDVLGKEVVQNIGSGETFLTGKLNIPPVVRSGSKVTMVYRNSLLEATASGIALEDAIPGQTVKVRNENSKRVVFGIAREEGLVEVKP